MYTLYLVAHYNVNLNGNVKEQHGKLLMGEMIFFLGFVFSLWHNLSIS